MEDENRMTNQGGEHRGDTSKPDNMPPGKDADGERRRDTSKPDSRPTPSGVPNEGRALKRQPGSQAESARQVAGSYKYKGGRQQPQGGGVPNPDDAHDHESAGSFRGLADQDIGTDGDGEQSTSARRSREHRPNSQTRNPK